MTEAAKTELLDLGRELTCSICTEILYQPLTLLDCLHIFCGSCLKEWFSWQSLQATPSRSNPFTCPSCRASVRETRPNATITTLLDMYLQANPSRGRTEQEKEATKKKYIYGENVLPKVDVRKERQDEAEDRRMIDEVREMSLREVGIRAPESYERAQRGNRHIARERTQDAREVDRRRQGRSSEERSSRTTREGSQPSSAAASGSQARQIEHQPSLRSLLNDNSTEMHDEILRQIMDEGILDGVDLNNLDVAQEDELSERIANAYRRRHHLSPGLQNSHTEPSSPSPNRDQRSDTEERRQRRRPERSLNAADQPSHSSHPPLSRPHLLETYPTGQGGRRRTSSEARRQTSPNLSTHDIRTSSETQRQASRSATDLSNRPTSSSSRNASGISAQAIRPTDSDHLRPQGESRVRNHRTSRSPNTREREPSQAQASLATISPPRSSGSDVVTASPGTAMQNDRTMPYENNEVRDNFTLTSHPPASSVESLPSFEEPSIACDRCGKVNIEYSLHWNCSVCNEGNFNLCRSCYRKGRGCLHWYGFGYAATQRHRQQELARNNHGNLPFPHRLVAHRYLQPPAESHKRTSNSKKTIPSDPIARLQAGAFCSNCSKATPECYWRCEICNEGEWGYCNSCVNQGSCCTHALLPLSYSAQQNLASSSSSPSAVTPHFTVHTIPTSPRPVVETSSTDQIPPGRGVPLTFSTNCDICTYPIPPSITRFHCPQCNGGDYDIDAACYHRLVHTGKITSTNGPKGWRCCPRGHRMIVVGFEDSNAGQRRIVVEDLVGGHTLLDNAHRNGSLPDGASSIPGIAMANATADTSNPEPTPSLLKMFPPNGGVGKRVLAKWSWWPDDEEGGTTTAAATEDDLAFPKRAEIRECEEINPHWFMGVYCGKRGLFPSNYVRVLDVVGI